MIVSCAFATKRIKENFYECYETFYQPSNMMLVVTGNFKNQDVLNILKNNEALNNLEKTINKGRTKKYE